MFIMAKSHGVIPEPAVPLFRVFQLILFAFKAHIFTAFYTLTIPQAKGHKQRRYFSVLAERINACKNTNFTQI